MGNGGVTLKAPGGRVTTKGKLYNGLYLLNHTRAQLHPMTKINVAREQEPADWLTWHKRYGHVAYSGLKRLY
jgi:hypothetical protein